MIAKISEKRATLKKGKFVFHQNGDALSVHGHASDCIVNHFSGL